jgi:hypothetical protein
VAVEDATHVDGIHRYEVEIGGGEQGNPWG